MPSGAAVCVLARGGSAVGESVVISPRNRLWNGNEKRRDATNPEGRQTPPGVPGERASALQHNSLQTSSTILFFNLLLPVHAPPSLHPSIPPSLPPRSHLAVITGHGLIQCRVPFDTTGRRQLSLSLPLSPVPTLPHSPSLSRSSLAIAAPFSVLCGRSTAYFIPLRPPLLASVAACQR